MSAPGRPGMPPRWTSSAKSAVGTAVSAASPVWFTVSHGILDEVYYPRVDEACTRDLGLIVTGADGYFSEVKRSALHATSAIDGVPAVHITSRSPDERYRLVSRVCTDPARPVLLQHIAFHAAEPGLRVFVLLAPHLANRGYGNTAWVDSFKGRPRLVAERAGTALALVADAPWLARSAGYVGVSDGWQQLRAHGELARLWDRAEDGNVALCGEIDLESCGGSFTLALGFGRTPAEASHRAIASLHVGFEPALAAFTSEWQEWLEGCTLPGAPDDGLARSSAAVLRSHESVSFPGGIIASLSIPWGFDKGDDDLGGYHLVWPRDLVEAAGGLLAIGADADAMRVLDYLWATQDGDGHWPQNMWLDGTPYWTGIQLDETALPILLVDAWARNAGGDATRYWPMVRRAAAFLVAAGPVTPQDRWEEDAGYSPFTLAASIAGLLVAADLADRVDEPGLARHLRETADFWNDSIEQWTYVAETSLAAKVGVAGYYVRIGSADGDGAPTPAAGWIPIKNRPPGEDGAPADHIVSPDALALVRFGLRRPEDPRIVDSVAVIDHLLAVALTPESAWRRYPGDGYGEHDDGSPFDGSGVGRPWPLLTGERAHYELAAERPGRAAELADAMAGFSRQGLLPEHVWDGPDLPAREMVRGRPSGSAMPLLWAHAEYLKLRRSLDAGSVFDLPPQTAARYGRGAPPSCGIAIWKPNHKIRRMAAGRTLRIELPAPALVRWSQDHWATSHDATTAPSGLGTHCVDVAPQPGAAAVVFSLRWNGEWEGADYTVALEEVQPS